MPLRSAGWWWGSVRLDALDRSVLAPEIGQGGPIRRWRSRARDGARSSRSACPAQVRRFGARESASLCSCVYLRLARRRRAPSSRSTGEIRRRAGPRTASTSAPGFAATACTSSSVPTLARVGRRGGLAGFADRLRARISRRWPPASAASGARSWPASCSARTRGSRRSSATTSARRASTTCSRSRVRTSRSSPAARCCSRGWSGSLAGCGESARSRRSAATSWRSAGSRRSSAPGWRERSRRSPGWPRVRAIAGTSCSSARRCCSPGTRTRCSSRASSSRSRPSPRSSSSCRALERRLEGYPVPALAARRSSPSPARAGSRRRRSSGSSSAPSRSTRCFANALAAPAVAPLLGLALVAAALAARAARRSLRRSHG